MTGLEKSDAGAAGGTAATTRGVVSTETLFITNYDILRAGNVAGKLSFFAKIDANKVCYYNDMIPASGDIRNGKRS